jgi:hypothetical protein
MDQVNIPENLLEQIEAHVKNEEVKANLKYDSIQDFIVKAAEGILTADREQLGINNVVILKKINDVLIQEDVYRDLLEAANEQHITVGNLISDFIHKEAPVQLNI